MDLDTLSMELDDHLDDHADSEMPSAEAGTTMTPDTQGEVASALGSSQGLRRLWAAWCALICSFAGWWRGV